MPACTCVSTIIGVTVVGPDLGPVRPCLVQDQVDSFRAVQVSVRKCGPGTASGEAYYKYTCKEESLPRRFEGFFFGDSLFSINLVDGCTRVLGGQADCSPTTNSKKMMRDDTTRRRQNVPAEDDNARMPDKLSGDNGRQPPIQRVRTFYVLRRIVMAGFFIVIIIYAYGGNKQETDRSGKAEEKKSRDSVLQHADFEERAAVGSGEKVETRHNRYEAMEDLTLPNGDKMPWFGFGTWQLLKKKGVRSIRSALEMGYRMVDTAQMTPPDYDETATGEALVLSKVDRKKIFIVTKVDPFNLGYENTLKSIGGSLKNLNTDYIDLLLIHAPTCGEACEKEPGTWQETWRAMEELHRRGHVRNLGVSNFDEEQMAELVKLSTIAPAAVQNFFDPFHTDDKVRAFCHEHNIAYMGYTTLGFGYMRESNMDTNPVLSNPVINNVAKRLSKEIGRPITAAQVVLRWAISQGVIMIPASSKKKHQKENLDCLELKLTDDDIKAIAGLAGTLELPEEEDGEEREEEREEEDEGDDPSRERQEGGPEDEAEQAEEIEEDMFPTLRDLKDMAKEYQLGKTGKAKVHQEADPEDSLLFIPLDSEDVRSKLVVLKAETGKLLWTFSVYGHFGSAPMFSINRQVVYFTTEDLHVYALRTVNGKILWDFHGDFSFLAEPVFGGNGALYVGDMSGRVYALEAKTGKLLWKKRVGKEGIWSRATTGLEELRRVVYIATLDPTGPNIFALDAASGDVLWQAEVDGAVTSPLVMSSDLKTIFVGATGTIGKTKAKVFAISTATHSVRWSTEIANAADFSPGVTRTHNSEMLLVTHQSGNMAALVASDGTVEMNNTVSSSAILAPPLFVQDSMAILASTDGHLYEAHTTGKLAHRIININSPIWGRPVISSDGIIYFASLHGTVIAVEFGSNTILWRKNLHGFVAASLGLL